MSLIVYKGYAAKVDFDASRVCLAGKITGIEQDIFFYGKTLEEIQSEFHKAVEAYLASLPDQADSEAEPGTVKVSDNKV